MNQKTARICALEIAREVITKEMDNSSNLTMDIIVERTGNTAGSEKVIAELWKMVDQIDHKLERAERTLD